MVKLTRLLTFIIWLFLTSACCQNTPDLVPQTTNTIEPVQTVEERFIDSNGRQLLVNYDTLKQTAALDWQNRTVTLHQVRSASGTKYSDGNQLFWSKGDSAMYVKNGTTLFKGSKQP